MTKRSAALWLLSSAIFLIMGCAAWKRAEPESAPPAVTPEAQAARINAMILTRKVANLRNVAQYLRLRSEGELLLRELREGTGELPKKTSE